MDRLMLDGVRPPTNDGLRLPIEPVSGDRVMDAEGTPRSSDGMRPEVDGERLISGERLMLDGLRPIDESMGPLVMEGIASRENDGLRVKPESEGRCMDEAEGARNSFRNDGDGERSMDCGMLERSLISGMRIERLGRSALAPRLNPGRPGEESR